MNPQRGSIIIYSLIMLMAMLSISVVLIGLFISKLRAIQNPLNSARAIFVADSAAELCIYEARKQVVPSPLASPLMTNGGTYTIASLSAIAVDVTASCVPMYKDAFRFRATGVYKGVGRSLEIYQ